MTGITETSYNVTGLSPGTTYYFIIKANNGSCNSANLTATFTTTSLPPTITGFTTTFSPSAPIYLCSNGGSIVTITGTNLATVTSVLFNGASGVTLAGTITGQTATTITVTAPAGVEDGIIRVTNPAGFADSATPDTNNPGQYLPGGLTFVQALPPTVGVSPAASICSGSSTTLTATGGNTYSWSPALGLNGTSAASVVASPTANTTYTVTGITSAGCTATNTVAVTVLPVPTAVSIAKNPSNICIGGTTTLTATGGTVGSSGSGKLGSGTATNTTSTPYKGWWGGQRTQQLYTAAELTALGIASGGTISSIGFVVQSGTPLLLNGFTVKAGFVSATTLGTAFIAGATTTVLTML